MGKEVDLLLYKDSKHQKNRVCTSAVAQEKMHQNAIWSQSCYKAHAIRKKPARYKKRRTISCVKHKNVSFLIP